MIGDRFILEVVAVSTELSIETPPPFELTVLTEGARGPQGPAGIGTTFSVVAGEDIPGHRVIVVLGGVAFAADPTNLGHADGILAVSRDAVSDGDEFSAALGGEINGGSFVQGTPYFVGLGGVLSSTVYPVGAVWMRRIGVAKSSSELIIDMDPVIYL